MIRISMAALAVAMAVAGAASAADITDDQIAALKIGATTYSEIVAQFGKPMSVETSSDGSKTITYNSSHTHVKAATFVPIVGMFAGGARGDVSTNRFEFNADGVLTKTWQSETHINCKTFGGCKSQ
ncbi:hypothetical protein [Caulobacter sp. S45]|uniref:hypothetical protein n=1 Tax=Caulobacter sp. S45 TaxID=1641861 RepID=UPI00131B1665|nr:hypothetical protein [Caulobacter sp. S45]